MNKNCLSCGAKMILNSDNTKWCCEYCGSIQVIDVINDVENLPKGIIPFVLDKDTIIERFNKFIKKKIFAPEKFRKNNQDIELKGMYIPFYLFYLDTNVSSQTCGWVPGNKGSLYEHYNEFKLSNRLCVLQPDSKELNIDFAKGLEPYNLDEVRIYESIYLTNYSVENISKDFENLRIMAAQRVIGEWEKEICMRGGYEYLSDGKIKIDIEELENKQILLPVWFIKKRYKDEVYNYVINGQTGKIVGEVPISTNKFIITLVSMIVFLIFYFMLNFALGEYSDIFIYIGAISVIITPVFPIFLKPFLNKKYKSIKIQENIIQKWNKQEKLCKKLSREEYENLISENGRKYLNIQTNYNGIKIKETFEDAGMIKPEGERNQKEISNI